MIKGIIFDFDGTLVNTLEDLADAGNLILKSQGWPEHPVEDYKYFIGGGILNLLEACFPEDQKHRAPEFKESYVEQYHNHAMDKTRPYVGVESLISTLQKKEIPLAILTNKEHDLAFMMANTLFPTIPDELIHGAKPATVPFKPNPQSALAMADKMGLNPEEILFVGDSRVDMETAVNAGMTPCGVRWGFRTEEELLKYGARHLVSEADEILSLLD